MLLNKGRRFIRDFDSIADINDFCNKYSCVPINVIPIVVRTDYRASGATSALNTTIPKYSYATILQPVEDGMTSSEIENEIAAIDAGLDTNSSKDSYKNKQKSSKSNVKYSQSEVERLTKAGKADPNEELNLDNIDYKKIDEMLHYDAADKKRSKAWFMQNKHRPLDVYATYMALQPWQISILEIIACNPGDYR